MAEYRIGASGDDCSTLSFPLPIAMGGDEVRQLGEKVLPNCSDAMMVASACVHVMRARISAGVL